MDQSKKTLITDTLCILPWTHLHTWPTGKVYQCCLSGWEADIGDLANESLEDIWNNDYMKDLRTTMLDGKKHKSCMKCYEQEDMGTQSFRQGANLQFHEHSDNIKEITAPDGTVEDLNLVYWDFRFSNVCNMKCRMCGDLLSSMWADENIKMHGGNSFNKFSDIDNQVIVNTSTSVDLYKYIDMFIDSVEEIYFAGGEPLLMKEHYYILEKLIKIGRTDVRIRYNTNLSKLKHAGYDCESLWTQFDNVNVVASIDAYGERAEYARSGTVWETVERNLYKVIAMPSVRAAVSPTINIWNIFHLSDFIDRMLSMGLPIENIQLNNVLTHPAYYHINILTDEMKEEAGAALKAHLQTFENKLPADKFQHLSGMYTYILNYLYSTSDDVIENRRLFKKETARLDECRDASLEHSCPELWEFYKQC